jgi:hypothetical protein
MIAAEFYSEYQIMALCMAHEGKLMTKRYIISLAICLTIGAGVQNAHALTPISGLFDTGVDGSGTPLAEGATDTHYVLNGTSSPFVYDHPAYLVPADARFIAAQVGGGYTVNPNTYTLTFDLTGLKASTASLSGNFEADNYGSIYLNGNLIGQDIQATVYSNFQSYTAFSASGADFVSGVNTLTFVINDTGAPSAFAVSSLSGTASAVPELSTWGMMLAGFAGLGLAGYRRKISAFTAV